MSWFLEVLARDGSVQQRAALPAGAALAIGRALDNDVVLDDAHVAPYHARLELDAGGARLVDLGTVNGIADARGKRLPVHAIGSDAPFRLGHTQLRVRSTEWALAPELPLSGRPVWPFALLGLLAVLGNAAWDVWLTDVTHRTPQYVYTIAAAGLGITAWSAFYALLGRLISGVERFFTHLVIASAGYLTGVAILSCLDALAFAMAWLWPVRIQQAVVVLVVAGTVRLHLKLADPRHWPVLRHAVALVAAIAIALPIGQQWISHGRLTDIQVLQVMKHPALRIAAPQPIDAFAAHGDLLRQRVDALRKREREGAAWYMPEEE